MDIEGPSLTSTGGPYLTSTEGSYLTGTVGPCLMGMVVALRRYGIARSFTIATSFIAAA